MMVQKTILSAACLLLAGACLAQGYQVTLQTTQYKSGTVYLTYKQNPNSFNVQDSAAFSNKGTAIFTGKQRLPGGIYIVVLPGKRLSFDFFVDKGQRISVKVDTTDFLNKTVITGSPENALYVQYQKYVAVKGKQLQDARTAYMRSTNAKDSATNEANYNKYNKELNGYRDDIIKNKPQSMLATLFTAMQEPVVPIKKPVTQQDSLINYNYYKAHYWDGITFMDERVIRTPFFLPKLERYYREVLVQAADTIIKDVDYKLLLARTCPEMYKFLLNWLTDEYINPKYMGQDAVFVHLFEQYHARGLTSWLNEKQMQTISRRAYMLMANLIGEKAANLEMIDSTGKPAALYDINAEYTVVCFWDPTCGHCKEEVPKIDSVYKAGWKQHNVKIYAVLTEDVKKEWVNYTKEHNLNDWTHVYQTKEMEQADNAAQKPGFRQLYDVTVTPKLYLLDKDKRIIAKNLGWQQLNDLLQVKWKK
jgi:thiol-disulfide isomerase/thioredoxin